MMARSGSANGNAAPAYLGVLLAFDWCIGGGLLYRLLLLRGFSFSRGGSGGLGGDSFGFISDGHGWKEEGVVVVLIDSQAKL